MSQNLCAVHLELVRLTAGEFFARDCMRQRKRNPCSHSNDALEMEIFAVNPRETSRSDMSEDRDSSRISYSRDVFHKQTVSFKVAIEG